MTHSDQSINRSALLDQVARDCSVAYLALRAFIKANPTGPVLEGLEARLSRERDVRERYRLAAAMALIDGLEEEVVDR